MILNHLTGDEVARHFDQATLSRATAYAVDGSVSSPEIRLLEAERVEVVAYVTGSAHASYAVRLTARRPGSGSLQLDTTCNCPVGRQCKHGAALALVLSRSFTRERSAAEPGWEDQVAELLDDLGELVPARRDLPGVALSLTYVTAPVRSFYYDSAPRVRIRPLRPGARHPWVKTGMEWSEITAHLTRGAYDHGQLSALRDLAECMAGRTTYGFLHSDPSLEDFGPDVVTLLRRARTAGVTFVTAGGVRDVRILDEPLGLAVDAAATDAGTVLTTGLRHDGRLWRGADVLTWGDPAHSVGLLDEGTLVIAQLTKRLTAGPLRALRHGRPVTVPPSGTTPGHLPEPLHRLVRLLPVTSDDDSVSIPVPPAPRLVLRVVWSSSREADVSWHWAYGEASFADAEADPRRDPAAEHDLLARLPHRTDLAPRTVTGVDVLHLALLELPLWRDQDDVEVVEVDAPTFRESEAAPDITFALPGPDARDSRAPGDPGHLGDLGDLGDLGEPEEPPGGHTDWLDLEVVVTIEGERVLLAEVLAALTLEQEHLILPSGLFVRTDRPEFARLREVVSAAAQLGSPDGDRVRVGRTDLGLWAQLDDLGVVDAQAAEWVSRARALRDLVDLPRPEPHGIASTLRGYQLEGFHWLAFLWQHRLGGILADDMGLGKTLQVLTLIAHTRATTDAPFLVVAPTSVVSAWLSEAARHAPNLRVRSVVASRSRRGVSVAELAAQADVVVTTYTLLRLEATDYATVDWAGLVLDEAQAVKNHQSKAYAAVRMVPASFRLAVTGTPFENRLLELWSLLSIVAPGLYPQPRAFTEQVVRPVEKLGDELALQRFTRRISPFILRRTKEVVAADLPPKQEQVLQVELNPRHRKIYDAHLAKERQRILGLVDDFDRNRVAILAALTTLRQLALDPALTDPGHARVGSTKLDLVVDQIGELAAEGHRALVFSTFTGFLRRVRDRLDAEAIPSAYLDGTTRHRSRVIEEFRTGAAPVFLISLKAGGVGLTLTEADYVFVLDPWWNPAAEAQAVDRAHRIGQDKTVMVYRLVSTDTIEDKVMALKQRKAALFARVIDGEGVASGAISAADIRALFD